MLDTTPLNAQPLAWGVSLVEESAVTPPDGPVTAWPFETAWPPSGQTYDVTYQYLTEVQVSRSGREYRAARRQTPRKEVRFATVLDGERLRHYKDLLWRAQVQRLAVPELHAGFPLPADMPAGSDALALDDPPDWLLPGVVVVVGREGEREALVVAAVAGDVTWFTDATRRSHPAGAPVRRGLVGHVPALTGASRRTNDLGLSSLVFAVRPLSELPPDPGVPGPLFQGREVFLKRPNWAEPVEAQMGRDLDQLDYGTGPISRYSAVPFGFELTAATYLGGSVEEARALVALLHRMRGQQGEFWMPTWEADMVLAADSAPGSTTLRVAGRRVAESYAGSLTHRAVFVQRRADEPPLLRGVTAIGVDGDDSLLTLDAPLPAGLAVAEVRTLGWLLLRRFATDNLTVSWVTDRVANVQINLRTLEVLPAEGE